MLLFVGVRFFVLSSRAIGDSVQYDGMGKVSIEAKIKALKVSILDKIVYLRYSLLFFQNADYCGGYVSILEKTRIERYPSRSKRRSR